MLFKKIKQLPFLRILVFIALGYPLPASAETRIKNDFNALHFKVDESPFIVENDIIVSENKEVVIDSGCIFLFNPFTGIKVRGRLVVNGTQARPVIFTSIQDSLYSSFATQKANPFDWNGIFVDKGSKGVVFDNIILHYSVYGIKAQTKDVVIRNAMFKNNGQFNVVIDDKLQNVQEDIAFSCEPPSVIIDRPHSDLKTKHILKRPILRYGCLGIGVLATGIGLWYTSKAIGYKNDYNSYNSQWGNAIRNGDIDQRAQIERKTKQAHDDFFSAKTPAIIFNVLGCAGLCGFAATFFF